MYTTNQMKMPQNQLITEDNDAGNVLGNFQQPVAPYIFVQTIDNVLARLRVCALCV